MAFELGVRRMGDGRARRRRAACSRGVASAPVGVSPGPNPPSTPVAVSAAGIEPPTSPGVGHARRTRRRRNIVALCVFAFAVAGVGAAAVVLGVGEPWYGIVGLGYLSGKLVLSLRYRPCDDPVLPGTSVAVVIPVFNEDPETFRRCIRAVVDQSWPASEIWVLDDGSERPECAEIARRVLAGMPHATVQRFGVNRGKRHVQAIAFRRTRAAIVCTVDSDTILDRDALLEGLRPFADDRVMAVTGNVGVTNSRVNVLTRLTTLRYVNAFLWERAAYSTLGSVVCCCGSLSFWRRELLQSHIEDYVGQTFLGVEVPYGDDRRLTNYALSDGQAVFQETSIAKTAVPERFGHFLRQQLRWNKSFFRESLWAIRHFSRLRAIWLLTVAEVGLWAVCATSVLWIHALRPVLTGRIALFAAIFMALLSYARSVRYLGGDHGTSWRAQLGMYLLSPLYSVLSTFVLVPFRLVSLATLTSSGWGTRRRVEVTLAMSVAGVGARGAKTGA